MTSFEIEGAEIRRAADRIAGEVHRTPLFGSRTLGERIGARFFLKCENLQKTGSFKVRGALNHLRTLGPEEREKGVVTISAGNHTQALAWAGRTAGIPATVVMPEHAPRSKVEACRAYGAEVVLHGNVFEAFERARALESERGLAFVHPFDDERIVAGQATVGIEVIEEMPGTGVVVVPVGGGGLIAGIGAALAARGADVAVYGVEPTGADAMRRSLERGEPVHLEEVDTVADGLGAPMAGELTYELVRRHVEGVVTVSDARIAEAMGLLLGRTKLLAEPAGAAAVAALLSGRIPVRGRPTVAILSGGNVDLDRLSEILALARGGDGGA